MKILVRHQKAVDALIPKKDQQAFLNGAIEEALGKVLPKAKKGVSKGVIEVYTDGGSRGNPGRSGGGYVVYKNGKEVLRGSEYYGIKTNNQAEYLALRDALRAIYLEYSESKVKLFLDSELAVRQMNGSYKVKSPNVKPLFQEVRSIADQFKEISFSHVRREENAVADELANDAMDRGR